MPSDSSQKSLGRRRRAPRHPRWRERWGRDLLHCPYCHWWEVRDQALGVLGTLPGSVDHAHWFGSGPTTWSTSRTPTNSPRRSATGWRPAASRSSARGIEVVGTVARLVIEQDRLTGVEMADGRVVARTAVLVRPGNVPHADGFLAGLGCELDEGGLPTVDATGLTSVPGVWPPATWWTPAPR